MKMLLSTLVVLAMAVAVALAVQQDTGYVLLTIDGWSVETSFTLFCLALVVLYLLISLIGRLLKTIGGLPGHLQRWRTSHRIDRARRSTQKGLLALAEGHWDRSEKLLIRHASDCELPLINFLAAAQAAQKLGADNRRDHYLSQAHRSMPAAELAVGLTQANAQISHGQYEQALATLMHLRSVAPKHPYVLHQLRRLYERLSAWDDLIELLPDLKRHKVLNSAQLRALEVAIHRERIERAGRNKDIDRLQQCWGDIPRALRQEASLSSSYADNLSQLGRGHDAERILADALNKQYRPQLIRLFAQTSGVDSGRQLNSAEQLLANNPADAELLLALGRLSLKNRLWGKARSYLEASLGVEDRAEIYCELGNLLEQLGEHDDAAAHYKHGLERVVGADCTQFTVGPSNP